MTGTQPRSIHKLSTTCASAWSLC